MESTGKSLSVKQKLLSLLSDNNIKLNTKMKLNLRKFGPISLVIVFMIMASACKNNQSTAPSDDDQLESFRQSVARVLPNLGSPGDIAMLIELTGADYVPELVADTANIDMYIGDSDWAALNLGLFTADLAYTSTFTQTDQSLATLRACQILANDLEMGETFQAAILNYYSDEITEEEKDSLIVMLKAETGKIRENFDNTDRKRLYTAFVTGFLIENLHIATGIIETYPDDLLPADAKALILREMLLVIIEIESNLDELIVLLGEVLTDDDPKILLKELTELQSMFDGVNIENLVTTEAPAEILKRPKLKEVTTKVGEIRASIIR